MPLDNKLISLEQLQQLEVGNVERIIGEIETSKNDVEKTIDKMEMETEVYIALFRDKLFETVQNIYLLKDQISDLRDEDYSFYPVDVDGETERMGLSKTSFEEGFSLFLSSFQKYGVNFNFRENPDSQEEISFYRLERVDGKKRRIRANIPSGEEYVLRVVGKDAFEFTDRFGDHLRSVIEENGTPNPERRIGMGNYNYSLLPSLLNLVPELVSRIYGEIRTARETEEEELRSKIVSLEALDTSDF